MQHLFCYGTLMVSELMQALCRQPVAGESAILPDYRCYGVRGAPYPAIIPANGERVTGLLYRNIEARLWPRLDRYEGELYRRETVQVVLANNKHSEAQAYVLRPRFAHLLNGRDWHLDGRSQDYAWQRARALRS